MFVCQPVLILFPAGAQDTRTVTEPTIPATCNVLTARLTAAPGGVLAAADEDRPDTRRIQQALDGCPPGKAVALEADGAANAFLIGPLQLRAGVTLLVNANTQLLGS